MTCMSTVNVGNSVYREITNVKQNKLVQKGFESITSLNTYRKMKAKYVLIN